MATFTKVLLSGSTNGRQIKVVATATPGTTIHTVSGGGIDEIHLWAVNSDIVSRKLTIEFGGTTSPNDLIEFTVPAEDGLYYIIPGLTLDSTATVRAFAATADVVMVSGFVNRIV